MKRNKDLVIEPNASLTDRKYTSENRGPVSTATGGKGRTKDAD